MSQTGSLRPLTEILHSKIEAASESVSLTATAPTVLSTLATCFNPNPLDSLPKINLLAHPNVMDAFDNAPFYNTFLANLETAGILEIRTSKAITETLLIADEHPLGIVPTTTKAITYPISNTDCIGVLEQSLKTYWNNANTHEFETVPFEKLTQILIERTSPELNRDFVAIFESLPSETPPAYPLTLTELMILLGAKHTEQFYNVSKWGEDVGLSSKSTFSRVKHNFEDDGIVKTRKISIPRGRPRQRLEFTASPETLMDNSKIAVPDALETILTQSNY